MDISRSILTELFVNQFKTIPELRQIAGGGSPRKYYRMTAEDISVVGEYCDDIQENECFLNLDYCLERNGIKVPHVIAVSETHDAYLMQDLGDICLLDLLKGPQRIELSEKAIKQLVKLQSLPQDKWRKYLRYNPFSSRLVMWDLNYFKYDFLKPLGLNFDEDRLEDDFERLANEICNYPKELEGFMYRDFQSRNVMVDDSELYFIDFQGARVGPIVYDPVSFLWQAKAAFTSEEKEILLGYYIEKTSESRKLDPDRIKRHILPFALFRTIQVLGAYGFRGLIEKKPHFIESIPYAVKNLVELKEKGVCDNYPELSSIIEKINPLFPSHSNSSSDRLTVTVFSFSYKKGYPVDNSGNGGGFMFDCRGLHNPGRYEEYKKLTGRDKSVADFLGKERAVEDFINNSCAIVCPSVEKYMERGFTSLQVGFGCTGGQHRSVYCAEKVAGKLKDRYGDKIRVNVIHREQNIEYER